jgi:hypothetical protein
MAPSRQKRAEAREEIYQYGLKHCRGLPDLKQKRIRELDDRKEKRTSG